ncbi:MAG: zinc ribbon domain-containing protein [Candidatus Kuenenia sp.]|nr:zinc ribbon domain-containing protein [Candidatus Kuenenia hertensis]
MPTYEYRCSECNHEFELFQSIKSDPVKECPSCGRFSVERIIGMGGAVIFKGSGFYQTDYRSDEYKSRAKKESEIAKPETKDKKQEKKAEKSHAES